MSAIKLNSSGGGSITISPASTASTLTLTAPAQTGTIGLDGPAFRAYYASGTQTVSSGVATKITFDAETFDTNNNFSSSRFTPTVAGYYQFNGALYASSSGGYVGQAYMAIYKNGSVAAIGNTIGFNGNYTGGMYVTVNDIFYGNGTTDYFEVYAYIVGTATLVVNSSAVGAGTVFSGAFVRAA